MRDNKRLKVFTWHIHGSYLYYLSQGDYDIIIPVNKKKDEGYYGRGETFLFGENVIEIPAEEIKNTEFDCILFQSKKNYLQDQFEILNEEQLRLPRLYLEHNTPWQLPADEEHVMKDAGVVMVHVTHYNKLMWKSKATCVKVIEHGVMPAQNIYKGNIAKGITAVNHLHERGRKLGADIYEEAKKKVPLDLVGMKTREYGGLGEVLHPQLPAFTSQYRFFFYPVRYTSLALAVCEAMMLGMPVVCLATTEYAITIENGISGFIHLDINYLIEKMKLLINDQQLAQQMGKEAKASAEKKFNINRFTSDWQQTFEMAVNLIKQPYEKFNSIYK